MFSAALVVAALALSPAKALWPAPKKLSTGHGVLFIDQTVEVTYNGQPLSCAYGYIPPRGPKFNSKDIVQSGVARALKGIFQDNFVPWKVRPRNSDFEPSVNGSKAWVKSIDIEQARQDGPDVFRPRAGDVDKSYSLGVSRGGRVKLWCASSTGCLHGLESLVQLFFKHSSGKLWYTPHAPVCIEDAPKFPHRGVIMDVARMWYPVEDIKRTLDAMSWNKMNRLHLHVTDSQSWPLEIPALPKLA